MATNKSLKKRRSHSTTAWLAVAASRLPKVFWFLSKVTKSSSVFSKKTKYFDHLLRACTLVSFSIKTLGTSVVGMQRCGSQADCGVRLTTIASVGRRQVSTQQWRSRRQADVILEAHRSRLRIWHNFRAQLQSDRNESRICASLQTTWLWRYSAAHADVSLSRLFFLSYGIISCRVPFYILCWFFCQHGWHLI